VKAYNLHGVHLGVAAEGTEGQAERAAEAIRARLAGLPLDGGPPHDVTFADVTFADVTFAIRAGDEHGFSRPSSARPVYEPPSGEVVYSDEADLLYIDQGPRLRVLCEPDRGRSAVSAAGLQETDLWLVSHPLFTVPLVEILKRRGLYGLHAGGVCIHGRALLLPGTSGSGKSTLTLALARAGLSPLGDDTVFLARRGPGLRVLAFPDEFDLTEQTVSFFPELRPLLDTPLPPGWRKRQLRTERAYAAEVVWECEPALLVYPRIAGRPESVLTPLDPGEALLELASNVLLTEPRSSQAHLDVLAELVEASECYRLETGTDLEAAVEILKQLPLPGPHHPGGGPR
jgi:hypothetical protein